MCVCLLSVVEEICFEWFVVPCIPCKEECKRDESLLYSVPRVQVSLLRKPVTCSIVIVHIGFITGQLFTDFVNFGMHKDLWTRDYRPKISVNSLCFHSTMWMVLISCVLSIQYFVVSPVTKGWEYLSRMKLRGVSDSDDWISRFGFLAKNIDIYMAWPSGGTLSRRIQYFRYSGELTATRRSTRSEGDATPTVLQPFTPNLCAQ